MCKVEKTVKLKKITEDVHEQESEKAFSKGISVVVLRGKELIQIDTKGKEQILKTYQKDVEIEISSDTILISE